MTERNELIVEKNEISERLNTAETTWAALKMEVNQMDMEWEENRKNLMKTVKDLREENHSLRGQLSNKDKEKKTEILLREGRIKELEHAIEIRKGNTNSLMTDLKNKTKEVEDMKLYVEEMREHASRAEKKVDELRKEKKMREERADTQINTPVTVHEKSKTLLAVQEKPSQESMIEEGESDISHSFMSAEEGACADLDSTSGIFKKPEPKPKRKTERKKSSRERRESSSEDSSQSGSRKRDRQGKRKDSEASQSGDKEMVDSLKEEIRKMQELRKVQEREMKEMKEELERKNLEIRDRENMIASTRSTPSKGKKSVVIINITDENRDKVSTLLGGMLGNDDGSYSRTPMSETWSRNKEIQLVSRHDTAPPRPSYLDNIPNHPNPSTLDCVWSFKGEWRDAPMEASGTGAQGTKTRVARIEPYVDYDGRIKKAICYGPKMGELRAWYDFEEVKKIFPNWDTSKDSLL